MQCASLTRVKEKIRQGAISACTWMLIGEDRNEWAIRQPSSADKGMVIVSIQARHNLSCCGRLCFRALLRRSDANGHFMRLRGPDLQPNTPQARRSSCPSTDPTTRKQNLNVRVLSCLHIPASCTYVSEHC